jgi:hypothetical protein
LCQEHRGLVKANAPKADTETGRRYMKSFHSQEKTAKTTLKGRYNHTSHRETLSGHTHITELSHSIYLQAAVFC